jgi:hypothetical protein
MAETTRSKQALGGVKSKPAPKDVHRMSLERTDNGHFKATHQFKDGAESEIHAIPSAGLGEHLSAFFGLSSSNEKAGIAAKQKNVKTYEKEHGSLLESPQPKAAVAPSPDKYDKIRDEVRANQSKPAALVPDLMERANALTKNIGK